MNPALSRLWRRRKWMVFMCIHAWIVGFMVLPGLGILVVSFYKLAPATLNDQINFNGAGVIIIGQVSSTDVTQDSITVVWSVGGWGPGYGDKWNDTTTPHPFPGIPSLTIPVNIYMDGQNVMSYDPAKVMGMSIYGSAATEFKSTYSLNAVRNFATLSSMVNSQYFVTVEASALNPTTNATYPISQIECGRWGPSLTGWTVNSFFSEQVNLSTAGGTPEGTYVLTIVVGVDAWKLSYELAMAAMILLGSIVAFLATTVSVFLVWFKGKTLSVSDLLAMPLAIGGTISALRAAFPPNSDLELFLDEAVYYPSFVLSVSCAVISLGLTRTSFVKLQKRMWRWTIVPPRDPRVPRHNPEDIIMDDRPLVTDSPRGTSRATTMYAALPDPEASSMYGTLSDPEPYSKGSLGQYAYDPPSLSYEQRVEHASEASKM